MTSNLKACKHTFICSLVCTHTDIEQLAAESDITSHEWNQVKSNKPERRFLPFKLHTLALVNVWGVLPGIEVVQNED